MASPTVASPGPSRGRVGSYGNCQLARRQNIINKTLEKARNNKQDKVEQQYKYNNKICLAGVLSDFHLG